MDDRHALPLHTIVPAIPIFLFTFVHVFWYFGGFYPSNSHYVCSRHVHPVGVLPFILRSAVCPFLCGPPNLPFWIELFAASRILYNLHRYMCPQGWFRFTFMFAVGCVGASASAFFFPAPFVGERTLWFLYFLAAKVFKTVELPVNNPTMSVRPFWFLVLLVVFVSYSGGALRPLVFMWFYTHVFFFLYFILPKIREPHRWP